MPRQDFRLSPARGFRRSGGFNCIEATNELNMSSGAQHAWGPV
jgi:hypothetical protein